MIELMIEFKKNRIDKHNRSGHHSNNRRPIIPSAPNINDHHNNHHSEEETWSPGAIPQHLYSRPPPYNF